MTILGFLFLMFVTYLAYRLVFDFILPVYRTTKRVRKSFREMSARMNQFDGQERMNQHTQPYSQKADHIKQNKGNNTKGGGGEYIDFEEIKD